MAKRQIQPNTKKKKESAYLTTRILVTAATESVKNAAATTLEVMGYNVIAADGWVVKKFPDGSTEQISPIDPALPLNGKIILD